jgi:protein-S-isoprenylcysteine O-methyltransferase Ste14
MQLAVHGHPGLASEREKPGAGTAVWDKQLLGVGFLLNLATLIVAGLDRGRFQWWPHLTWAWSASGALLTIVGAGIFLSALRENQFFSAVVRIQRDRGHRVCRTGPYKVVRHPGNAGMILGTIGLPLLLASVWSAIPALLSAVVLIARTQLEDAFLERDLEGYRDYQRETARRLVPGVW